MTYVRRKAEAFLKEHNIDYETVYANGFVKLNGAIQHISKIQKMFQTVEIVEQQSPTVEEPSEIVQNFDIIDLTEKKSRKKHK